MQLIARKIWSLTEVTRFEKETGRKFPKDPMVFLRKYAAKEQVAYLHFSNFEREGKQMMRVSVNPGAKYNTPSGVYAYPFTEKEYDVLRKAVNVIGKRMDKETAIEIVNDRKLVDRRDAEMDFLNSSLNSVSDIGKLSRYAMDSKYAHVIGIKGGRNSKGVIWIEKNGVSNFKKQDLEEMIEKIWEMWSKKTGLTGKKNKEDFLDKVDGVLEHARKYDALAKEYPPRSLWYLTRYYSGIKFTRWGGMLRRLGVDAIVDNGTSLIHHAEPYQMIVLNPRVLSILWSGENPLVWKMKSTIKELGVEREMKRETERVKEFRSETQKTWDALKENWEEWISDAFRIPKKKVYKTHSSLQYVSDSKSGAVFIEAKRHYNDMNIALNWTYYPDNGKQFSRMGAFSLFEDWMSKFPGRFKDNAGDYLVNFGTEKMFVRYEADFLPLKGVLNKDQVDSSVVRREIEERAKILTWILKRFADEIRGSKV